MRHSLRAVCVSTVALSIFLPAAAFALLPIPAFATCSPFGDATCVAGMPCDQNGMTVMDINGTNIYACLYTDAAHTSLVWETQYKSGGGGVTGGCTVTYNPLAYLISPSPPPWSVGQWGHGCVASLSLPAPNVNSTAFGVCTGAAASGYSCGVSSGSSAIYTNFIECLCVKN